MDVFDTLSKLLALKPLPLGRLKGEETYQSQLQQDLPNTEIIQSSLKADFSQKDIEAAFLTVLGLNIKVPTALPAVHEGDDMIRICQHFQNIHLPKPALAIFQARVWLLGLLDSPYSVGQRVWGLGTSRRQRENG